MSIARARRTLAPITLFAAAAIAAHASAGLAPVKIGETLVGDLCVVDVYIVLPWSEGHIVNVFATSVSFGGGFDTLIHNDTAGGTWLPSAATDGAIDTFVTIGGQPNGNNSTLLDPAWGPDLGEQVGIPHGAGWFNSIPTNFQGQQAWVELSTLDGEEPYSGYGTLVARLVFPFSPKGYELAFAGQTAWQVAHTPPWFETFDYVGTVGNIPGPGPTAILLLSCAVLVARRRRRA